MALVAILVEGSALGIHGEIDVSPGFIGLH